MKQQKPRSLVLAGDGIHSEQETAVAYRTAGFETDIRHINDLVAERVSLDEISRRYSVLTLPGGASFGDDLLAGKVLALKIKHRLGWNLQQFADRGGLVLGIGNGFQTLIRLEIFGKDISIVSNRVGRFQSAWVKTIPVGTKCVWLKGLGTMDLPFRSSAGRIVFSSIRRTEALIKMDRYGMTCLKYDYKLDESEKQDKTMVLQQPNQNIAQRIGSDEKLAGLCDQSGRIFGLMPHPEDFLRWTSHPEWTLQPGRAHSPGQGIAIFENAYHEAMKT